MFVLLDEFNEYCDRLEKTFEWGGQAEVVILLTTRNNNGCFIFHIHVALISQ